MILLVDNGSVRVESFQNLCRIASELSQTTGCKIVPSPLLHADKIPLDKLGGQTVTLLEDAIRSAYGSGERVFEILPLFFGASGALTDYLPRKLGKMKNDFTEMRARILPPLFSSRDNGGDLLAQILNTRMKEVVESNQLQAYEVILVDHGSPRAAVTKVRDDLAEMLRQTSENAQLSVTAASMERREGPEFDFNEPLLETALKQCRGSVPIVLVQLFLSPGRHAGPGGDIEQICEAAAKENPELSIYPTKLVGSHPLLIDLLVKRWREREATPWLST